MLHLPEGDGELTYRNIAPHTLDLVHTSVPPAARGCGIAERLVRTAFAHARQQKLWVVPTCPYVERWLERHPEERDLVVARSEAT